MKKIIQKIAGLALGLSLAVGVGISLGGKMPTETKAAEVTDTLVASAFAATNTTYTDFSGVSFDSNAVYAGNNGKTSNGGIQLRSKNSNSGIVTTASGGTLVSISIKVESGSNKLDVYGKTSAYSSAADLYNSSKQGTKIGSANATGSITLSNPSNYSYIGLRSNNGALYLTEISIVWDDGSGGGQATLTGISVSGSMTKTTYTTAESWSPAGLTVTASYDDGSSSDVTSSASWSYNPVSPTTSTTSVVATASYGGFEASSSAQSVTVNAAPGSADLPYTVAQARAAIDSGTGISNVYATGIVKEIPYAWTSSNGITFNMVDNAGDTNFLQAYKCKNTETVALNTIVVGDTVTIKGNLKKYNSTYEFDTGCTLVSLEHPAPVTEFTVTYNSNGGSGTVTDSKEYASGASVTVLENAFTAPSNFVQFKEFNTKADGTGNGYSGGETFNITENVTLYAIWEVKQATLPDGTYEATLTYSNPISPLIDVKSGTTTVTHLSLEWNDITYDDSHSEYKIAKDGYFLFKNNSNAKITNVTVEVYNYDQFDLYQDGSTTKLHSGDGSKVADHSLVSVNTEASSSVKVVGNGGSGTYSQNIYSISFTLLVGEAPVDVLNGITVSGAKTDFTVGEDFVTTGLVVTAHYEIAGDQVISTGYTVDDSEVDKTQAGTYTITVTYENSSDSYDVTYSAPTPVELSTYKKVKTNLADFSGKYLIVCEEEGALFAFDGSLTTLDASSNTKAITISNETISLSSEYEFTIASKENGYSIKSSSNLYIGQTSDANGLKSSANDDYTNSISFNGTSMDIISSSAYMRYNATSGQDRFRYFKSSTYTSQKAIALYQKVDDAEALALDLLNMTYGVCSQGYDNQKSDFESVWSTLSSAYNALDSDEKAKLAAVEADKDGVMLKESMARYDLLTGKYGLTNFITGRTPILTSGSNIYLSETNTNASTIIVVIVAITSITSIGVLLVIKKRRVHQ